MKSGSYRWSIFPAFEETGPIGRLPAMPVPPPGRWKGTLRGLLRSFSSLTEWLEIPAEVVAQIQGHKPSATAQKHYKRRPLDLLQVHHERIEAWILEQAGVQFAAKTEPGKLRVVA
jgi:hypothetical protein